MAFDIYTPATLIRVLESLENPPITFLRDRYYPFEQFSETEVVFFDVIDKKRRLAPFVSPLVEGKVMERRGHSTRSVRPAYVKPKSVIDPNDQFRRLAGEAIGGSLSPAERRAEAVRQALMEHDESLDMREEVMSAEGLRLGQVTISGEGFGTLVVAFGRDPALTITLSGTTLWSDPTAKPLEDIEAWALLVRQKSGGAIVRDVIMDPDAFAALRARLTAEEKQTLFDSLRGSESRVELGPRTAEKVKFEGRIGQFNFWTYADSYVDEDGVEQQVMPSGQVILAAPDVEGTRVYGAIRDPRAGLQAIRAFPKMWIDEDPPVEYVMTQSAPILVPLRPNASLGARVLP